MVTVAVAVTIPPGTAPLPVAVTTQVPGWVKVKRTFTLPLASAVAVVEGPAKVEPSGAVQREVIVTVAPGVNGVEVPNVKSTPPPEGTVVDDWLLLPPGFGG